MLIYIFSFQFKTLFPIEQPNPSLEMVDRKLKIQADFLSKYETITLHAMQKLMSNFFGL